MLDAASLAIVAALSTMKLVSLTLDCSLCLLRLPVSLAQKLATEKGDDLCSDGSLLPLKNLPVFATIHKVMLNTCFHAFLFFNCSNAGFLFHQVGESFIVDANKEEEACSFSR